MFRQEISLEENRDRILLSNGHSIVMQPSIHIKEVETYMSIPMGIIIFNKLMMHSMQSDRIYEVMEVIDVCGVIRITPKFQSINLADSNPIGDQTWLAWGRWPTRINLKRSATVLTLGK